MRAWQLYRCHCQSSWFLLLLPTSVWRVCADIFVASDGSDRTGCGRSQTSPCGSIAQAIIEVDVGSSIFVAAGDYIPKAGEDPYFTISKSLRIVADDGAKIDCRGKGSAVDILLFSGIKIVIQGLHFYNCTGVELDTGNPLRPWKLLDSRRPDWCPRPACACAIGDCSRAGGVSIIHQGYEDFDKWNDGSVLVRTFENVNVHFQNCTWTSNSAHMGAAVQLLLGTSYSRSSFIFERCTFQANSVVRQGGYGILAKGSAVYQMLGFPNSRVISTLEKSSIIFQMCNIQSNENHHGDGTLNFFNTDGWWDGVLFEFTKTNFTDNIVHRNGGGIGMWGGTSVTNSDSKNIVRISDTNFLRNRGDSYGVGGAFLGTFEYSSLKPSQLKLPSNSMQTFDYRTLVDVTNSIFDSNENFRGGAFCEGNGLINFVNTRFVNNRARQQGGAVVLSLGAGDSGAEFHDCIFQGNKANFTHTLVSNGMGPILFNNTNITLQGTQASRDDVRITLAGEASVTSNSFFICPRGSTMLVPTSGSYSSSSNRKHVNFEFETSGVLKPEWNHKGIGIGFSTLEVQCVMCPPGRYKTVAPYIRGPFWTRVCNPHNVESRIGNCRPEIYWQPDVTSTQVDGQRSDQSLNDCDECPREGTCPGGNQVHVKGRHLYGFMENTRTQERLLGQDYPPDSIHEWRVVLQSCPKGFCRTAALSWNATCLPHRTGFFCGRCEKDYSETWFGSTACVRDKDCQSWWWMGPVLLLALFAYSIYNYKSAQKGLYTPVDSALFFFQLYPYMKRGSQDAGIYRVIVAFVGMNFDQNVFEQTAGDDVDAGWKAKILCLAPGMTAYNRMWLGCAKALLMPILVLFVHFLAYPVPQACRYLIFLKKLQPAARQLSHNAERRTLRFRMRLSAGSSSALEPIFPCLAGLYKSLLFCSSGLIVSIFTIAACEDGYHTYAGSEKCSRFEATILKALSLACVLAPMLLAFLSHAVRSYRFLASARFFQGVREIQPLHENGLRNGFWWWPFAFATARGLVVVSPVLVNDVALGAALRLGIIGALVLAIRFIAPFEDEHNNFCQGVFFVLLFIAGAFSTSFAALEAEGVRWGNKLEAFVRFVVWADVLLIVAAAWLFATVLWKRCCFKKSVDELEPFIEVVRDDSTGVELSWSER